MAYAGMRGSRIFSSGLPRSAVLECYAAWDESIMLLKKGKKVVT